MANKIPRDECEFVTPEGRLSFMALYPGEHQESFGNRAYKIEWIGDIPSMDHPMVKAALRVAMEYDKNPTRHVFGQTGRLQRMEEKVNRKQYEYAQGKFVVDFSKVMSLKSLKINDLDLTNPVHRQRYDMALDEAAPCVHRYARVNEPADIVRIHQLNSERLLKGLPAYAEQDFHKVLLRVPPSEIWPGCYGHVAGYFYWNTNGKPATLGIGLYNVLMTREGERLVATTSPDEIFSGFAPSAELAPPVPARLPPVLVTAGGGFTNTFVAEKAIDEDPWQQLDNKTAPGLRRTLPVTNRPVPAAGGIMSLNQDDIKECLNLIDRIIGQRYHELNFSATPDRLMMRITAKCKSCRLKVLSAKSVMEENWASELVNSLIKEADAHYQKRHTTLIIKPTYEHDIVKPS